MKTLHLLLLSLFAFHLLLFSSTAPAQATILGSSAGSSMEGMNMRPPTRPRRHSPPPPTPGYSPEPGPGRTQTSPPTPFIVIPAATNSKISSSASA